MVRGGLHCKGRQGGDGTVGPGICLGVHLDRGGPDIVGLMGAIFCKA